MLVSACFPAVLGIALLAQLAAQESAIIVGRICDPSGTPLPGVTIKVIRHEAAEIVHTHTTSSEFGDYMLSLEPGTFALTAELAGFKSVTHDLVVVGAGDRRQVNFQMRLSPADHVDYVLGYRTVKEVFARSDIVARVVIADVSSATEWEMGHYPSVMGIVVTTQAREQLKGRPEGTGIQFLHFGSSSPYKAGQEYIVFLVWDENVKHFVGLAGDNYMITISNSRVTKTSPLEGVSIGMPVSPLMERLRSFLKMVP